VSVGIAISEIKASAAMNFLMTHLLNCGTLSSFLQQNTADRYALQ